MPQYVNSSEHEQLKAQLEDTQSSLAAALGRVEAYRIQLKDLAQQVAKLQLGDRGDPPHADAGQGQGAAGTPAAAGDGGVGGDGSTKLPAYITEAQEYCPIMLLQGGRKVAGSIVLTEHFVDFVEVRARVQREEFVGFASAPPTSPTRARGGPSNLQPRAGEEPHGWKQLLPGCLHPAPYDLPNSAQPTHSSPAMRPTAASSPGGSIAASDGAPEQLSGSEGRAMMREGSFGPVPIPQQQQQQHHSRVNSWGSFRSGRSSPGGSPKHAAPQPGTWHPLQQQSFRREDSRAARVASNTGTWQILWRVGGTPQHLTFEATSGTRALLHKHTAKWLGDDASEDDVEEAAAAPTSEGDEGHVVPPRHLTERAALPRMSEPSGILGEDHTALLSAALPARFQLRRAWELLYSTARHGISLGTLQRRAAGTSPCVLVVRDSAGFVFGAFTTDAWKVAPRFYGTGETFVFQLEPHRIMFPWKVRSKVKNDFFMYSTPECIAVGGLGRFALWLDAELLRGNSGVCGTFGSPCLAHQEDFKVMAVELWHVA